MKYKMIVRQTMFTFTILETGKLKLCGVNFLPESVLEKKNNQLLVKENGTVSIFVSGKTPLSHLNRKQFKFVALAARFFGHLNDRKNLPVWLWTGTLELPGNFPYQLMDGRESEQPYGGFLAEELLKKKTQVQAVTAYGDS